MKKAILAWALVMSMGVTQVSWASSVPKHRYQPATQQVEAYSDTTSTDTASYDDLNNDDTHAYHSKYSLGNYDDPFDFIGSVFGSGMLSAMVIFCVIFGLLFVLAPLIIFVLLIRYLVRRHNDRMKLAEMAMEKGINVPECIPGSRLVRHVLVVGCRFPCRHRRLDHFLWLGPDPDRFASCHQRVVEEPPWQSGHGV